MTKEEFIKHLLKAKVVLEKLAKKQDVYDEIEERMYEEYRKEEKRHPFFSASLMFRTPSTKNSPYLWRLLRLVFSTSNF